MRKSLAFLAVLVAHAASAGQVPNPANIPSPITTNHIVIGGTQSQNLADGGILGTGANQNIGTSGATIPLNSTANIFSLPQTFPAIVISDGTHAGSTALSFPTLAAFQAFQPTNVGSNMIIAQVAGNVAVGDGGSASYVWNVNSSASSANFPFVVKPTGWVGNGRWIMQLPNGEVKATLALKCDGTTDDSASMNALLATLAQVYPDGATVFIPAGTSCYFANTVSLLPYQAIRGTREPFPKTASFRAPDILLASTASLVVGNRSRAPGLYIQRSGISSPPTTMEQLEAQLAIWAGESSIGVLVNGDDGAISDSIIIGFNTCVKTTAQRNYLKNLHLDCANGLELTTSADTANTSDISVRSYWSDGLGGHFAATGFATISAGGSGYTNGGTVTLSTSGSTCATLPTFTVTASGGVVSALTPLDVGDCTAVFGNGVGVGFTGGGGSGLTATLIVVTGSYRPGIGINAHDQMDGAQFHNLAVIGPRVGIQLSNIWEDSFDELAVETGVFNDVTAKGLYTINCVSHVKMSNVYAESIAGTAVYFGHKSAGDGGSCGGATNSEANVLISNLSVGSPGGIPNNAQIVFDSFSRGVLSNLSVSGPGAALGASVVFNANVRGWNVNQVMLTNSHGVTVPWASIDSTSVAQVSIGRVMTETTAQPALSSCGAGAALSTSSNDNVGTITEGTTATGCTLTFNVQRPVAPKCTVSSNNGAATTGVTPSAASLAITNASATGNVYTYSCSQ